MQAFKIQALKMKKILLTFDVEEFDLPREFNQAISEKESYEASKQGLNNLRKLLEKHNIGATFFTTTNFAKEYPQLIRELVAKDYEIASHGYSHSDDYSNNFPKIEQAKKEIEKITRTKIKGFRAPRFGIKKIAALHDLGFVYDSSMHPTFIPGRYFNIHQKRGIHKIGNITEIPLSTLPFFRLPIFWLAFKNSPPFYPKTFTRLNFAGSDYTMLVFHPWEFADLSKIKIPKYIKAKHSQELLNLLEKYILFCKGRDYKFETVANYLSYHTNI